METGTMHPVEDSNLIIKVLAIHRQRRPNEINVLRIGSPAWIRTAPSSMGSNNDADCVDHYRMAGKPEVEPLLRSLSTVTRPRHDHARNRQPNHTRARASQ